MHVRRARTAPPCSVNDARNITTSQVLRLLRLSPSARTLELGGLARVTLAGAGFDEEFPIQRLYVTGCPSMVRTWGHMGSSCAAILLGVRRVTGVVYEPCRCQVHTAFEQCGCCDEPVCSACAELGDRCSQCGALLCVSCYHAQQPDDPYVCRQCQPWPTPPPSTAYIP